MVWQPEHDLSEAGLARQVAYFQTMKMAATQVPKGGRPRRFDDHTERRMLLDAAMTAMARDGFQDTAVHDVVAQAGLSTRAFYRHFDSKEALLVALMRRDAESAARSVEAAVSGASDPFSAVKGWLDTFLDIFYEPRLRQRMAVFNSVATALNIAEEWDMMRKIHCASLISALRVGHSAGLLYSPAPEVDAFSIHALACTVAGLRGQLYRTRDKATAYVLRFAAPALAIQGTQ